MDIEKLIEELGRAIAKSITNKKDDCCTQKVDFNTMDSTDMFKIMFNKFYHKGFYDKAEDLIFDELNKNNSSEIYEIAIDFYNNLLRKDDKQLIKGNLPREEIYQGLESIKKFNNNK